MSNEWEQSFGKVAYDAYCETRGWKSFKGDPLPQWNEQSEDLRKSWVVGAHAAIKAYREDVEQTCKAKAA